MKRQNFIKIKTEDSVLSRLQDSISVVFKSIFSVPLLYGNKITAQLVANKDQAIAHGLDRPYIGYILLTKNNYGDIKLSSSVNNNKDRVIILQSSAAMLVELWIF